MAYSAHENQAAVIHGQPPRCTQSHRVRRPAEVSEVHKLYENTVLGTLFSLQNRMGCKRNDVYLALFFVPELLEHWSSKIEVSKDLRGHHRPPMCQLVQVRQKCAYGTECNVVFMMIRSCHCPDKGSLRDKRRLVAIPFF